MFGTLGELVREGAVTISSPAVVGLSLKTVVHLDGDVTTRVSATALDRDGQLLPVVLEAHMSRVADRLREIETAARVAGSLPIALQLTGATAAIGSAMAGSVAETLQAQALSALAGALSVVGTAVSRVLVRQIVRWSVRRAVARLDAESKAERQRGTT